MKNIFALVLVACLLFTIQGNVQASAREEFQEAVEGLKVDSSNNELRKKVIALGLKLDPSPAVPMEAKRFMARGEAALESANNEQGFLKAVEELQTAVDAAPWLSDTYYNLGIVQNKAGQHSEALKSLNFYMQAAPDSPDLDVVQKIIFKLEYKLEEKKESPFEKLARLQEEGFQNVLEDLTGEWIEEGKDRDAKFAQIYSLKKERDKYRMSIYAPNYDAIIPNTFEFQIDSDGIIEGSARIDQTFYINGDVWYLDLHGHVEARGPRMFIQYTHRFPNGATGNRANGWGEQDIKTTLTKLDNY